MVLRGFSFAAACAVALIGLSVPAQAMPSADQTVDLAGATYQVQPHVRAGLKPIHPAPHAAASKVARNVLTVRSNASQGVVSPNPKVYVVFWGSQWSADPAGAAPALQNFFTGLHGSADNWGTVMTQYCEGVARGTANCGTAGIHINHPTSSILAGVWFDNTAPAPATSTQAQIAAEAARAATHFGNTTQTPNLDAQYVIASATGTHPDGFPNSGFCAWHDFTASTSGNLAYTNLPYLPDLGAGGCTTIANPTLLDGYFSTETHEYAEVITDFWPSIGWNGSGGEIGDECQQLDARLNLGTGTFDMQGIWSNTANKCVTNS
ncbi:hypothetical protein Lfu02_41680 [Longispora fulva]|uniref:Uncharacterized protein n=1 Tax=Longispora fulva TaxID=619741 RepID=A0A8J7GH71_9ACTN|nr:hypothetical protein [Longispora fulva]MBG6136627.1 hypothetical protein [Longispora fulva]GIG59796.1 hypothetical protein Lfu02_41680 [Longispora fulva]